MTLIEQIADRETTAYSAAKRRRDEAPTRQERDKVCMKSYYQGQAVALNDANTLVREELRRLMNKFQNGALTLSDFGVEP